MGEVERKRGVEKVGEGKEKRGGGVGREGRRGVRVYCLGELKILAMALPLLLIDDLLCVDWDITLYSVTHAV